MAEVISKRSIVYDITFETGKAEKGAQDIGRAMDKTEKDINDATKAVTNFADKTLSAAARLRQIKAELNNFRGTEAQFQKLSLEAAKLTDQIQKTNQRIAVLASSTRNIQALASAFSGLTGVFTAVQGAQALFGKESENVQRALVKLQGSLALLQGVQAAVATITEQSAAKTVIMANAQKLYTFVTSGATLATRAFRAALLATGAGIVIAGIAAIVLNWEKVKKAIGLSTEEIKKHGDEVDKVKQKYKELEQEADKLRSNFSGSVTAIQELTDKFKSAGLDEQSKIIKELQEISGNYFGELEEGVSTVDDINAAFDKFKKALNVQTGIELARKELDKLNATLIAFANAPEENVKPLNDEIQVLRDRLLSLNNKLNELGGNPFEKIKVDSDEATERVKELAIEIEKFQSDLIQQAELEPITQLIDVKAIENDLELQRWKERTEVINETASAVAAYTGAVASSFGSLQGLAKEGSAAQIALAEVQILASYASAIASAIQGAASSGAATGPAALFTTPSFIATLVASTIGAFAASFSNLQKAKSVNSGTSNTATAFAEGEVDIHRSGETRGKDSIPAIIMPGESVITTDKTAKYKPFLEAIHNGNLEDLIRVNYVEPALAVKALEGNDSRSIPDYSEKLYRQILVANEGNTIHKRSARILASIDRKLTPKQKRHPH